MSYRTQTKERNDLPNIIKGATEGGFVVPLVLALTSCLFTMFLSIDQALDPLKSANPQWSGGFNLGLFLGLFAIANFAESLAIGFGDTEYAVGYILGAICGLFVFAEILTKLFPDLTLGVIGVVVVVAIGGVVLKIIIMVKRSQADHDYYRRW
ncbi:hypothetical protein [Methanoculleus chikugoensis]|uniref:hypothetical protein n=1 Tax=Methanoculleus chikugoensis TaxID=118126 RepID=UPI000A8475EF|nr:hypothetical protein [Methanoculleus chikugoensis]